MIELCQNDIDHVVERKKLFKTCRIFVQKLSKIKKIVYKKYQAVQNL